MNINDMLVTDILRYINKKLILFSGAAATLNSGGAYPPITQLSTHISQLRLTLTPLANK